MHSTKTDKNGRGAYKQSRHQHASAVWSKKGGVGGEEFGILHSPPSEAKKATSSTMSTTNTRL